MQTSLLPPRSLQQKYEKCNQGHVFQFYATLSKASQSDLCQQLSRIDPESMHQIYQSALSRPASSSPPSPLAEEWVASTTSQAHPAQALKDWRDLGMDLIRQDQVAVITLAGGQGTRLGSSAPKGIFDIGLASHKSLFQLQAERLLQLRCLAAGPFIDWYIMTSEATHEATETFFKAHEYFGYPEANLIFFKQGSLPTFSSGTESGGSSGRFLLASKSALVQSPDGNGGLFHAMLPLALGGSGLLERMQQRGTLHLHVYCVDNVLVRVADPLFIGYSVSKQLEIGCKAVEKVNPEESVGVICLQQGRPVVIEYSEMSLEHRALQDAQGRLVYRFGNIANHYFSVAFLCQLLLSSSSSLSPFRLNYHIAHKKVPHIDLTSGQLVTPTLNNGIKLESFIFDIFPFAKRLGVLLVDRSEEFSPLKNASGSGVDCPETTRADLLRLHQRYLKEAGYPFYHSCDTELSAFVTYGGEGLPCLKKMTRKLPLYVDRLEDFCLEEGE